VLGWLLSKLWLACRELRAKIIDNYVIVFLLLFLVALGVGAYSENKVILLKSFRIYLYSSIAGALLVFVFLYYIHSFANQLRLANVLGVHWNWNPEDDNKKVDDVLDIMVKPPSQRF